MDTNQQSLILLVDDQIENLDLMMKYLNEDEDKFEFSKAPNGKLACKVAEKRNPDLIIMDWEMPEMDGFEALLYLKKNKKTQHIPVIMATGRSAAEDLSKALKAGAADYIRKPIEKQELLARVNSCLSISYYIKEIQYKNDRLLDLNREKDGMIDIVAHDLKSPLHKINGLMYLIPMVGELNEEQKDYISKINEVITQGSNLIRDILDVNTIEHQESKLNQIKINIQDFISHWVASYESEFKRKEQLFHSSILPADLEIITDKSFLSRILDNLLTNAIKFSERGQNINLKVEEKENKVLFSVKDQGPGISQADQKKMFKKFQKLEALPTGGETSNGLGLSIVKALTEKLNGQISINSEIGKGTEFILVLPKKI